MTPDAQKIRNMKPEERRQLYENARKHPDGQEVIDFINAEGLALSSGGLSLDHPVHRRIVELVWSKEAQRRAIEATNNGIPALCGVDPLLQADLGDHYAKYDLGTASAGAVVAEVMRHLGYVEDGHGSCPDGCRAKTGLKWRPRSN